MFAIICITAAGSRTVLDGIATHREANELAWMLKQDNPGHCYGIVPRP